MKKCCKSVDGISRLPDDIIFHILSFLPPRDAASAALVSRRWLYLSRRIFNLRFEYKDYGNFDYNIRDVDCALKSHKALSLQEFKIDFHVPKSSQHHVAKWLGYAFSRHVERLDLNLGTDGAMVERCEDGAVLDEEMLKEIDSFKSLKVLCLRCFIVRGVAVELFLRNCPLLETLLIYRSRRRSHLVVDSPSLKHLDMRSRNSKEKYMDISDPRLREKYSIRVCAPNLTWLTIDQNSKVLFLECVPKLVNLHFFYRPELGDTMHHFANVAAQLETLIIHLFNPEAAFSVPAMPKLKKLVVYFRTNWANVSLPVTRFISASPCLEEFRLEISELYTSPTIPKDIFEVPKAPSPHSHLKRFVLSGYCGLRRSGFMEFGHCDVSLELVRYMVENCVGLEEIVIGQCHRAGLVRDIVDYVEDSLDDIIIDPAFPHHRYVATPAQRQAFERIMQLQQIPARINLRIVFEVDTKRYSFFPGIGY